MKTTRYTVIVTIMLWVGTLASVNCLAGELIWQVETTEPVFTENGDTIQVALDGYNKLSCPGKPQLPAQRILLALPPGTRADRSQPATNSTAVLSTDPTARN